MLVRALAEYAVVVRHSYVLATALVQPGEADEVDSVHLVLGPVFRFCGCARACEVDADVVPLRPYRFEPGDQAATRQRMAIPVLLAAATLAVQIA